MADQGLSGNQDALDFWRKGCFLDAGRLVFEALASENRPIWCCDVLRFAAAKLGAPVPIAERVLEAGTKPSEWPEAKALFSEVRQETINLEGMQRLSRNERATLRLLYLTELVAKVLYNCTDPLDPFDEDSGWWIAKCLKEFLESFEGVDSSSLAWSVLSKKPG
jgi:hypothetical protein